MIRHINNGGVTLHVYVYILLLNVYVVTFNVKQFSCFFISGPTKVIFSFKLILYILDQKFVGSLTLSDEMTHDWSR